MPTAQVDDATLIYSCRASEFIVCRKLDENARSGVLVEYRLPDDFNKIVVRYRLRLPEKGILKEIYTMTAYLRPYFPSGAEAEEDQRRG
jgi:hypothetical protein